MLVEQATCLSALACLVQGNNTLVAQRVMVVIQAIKALPKAT